MEAPSPSMLPYSVISNSPPLIYFFTQCPTFTLSSHFCLFVYPVYACLYPLLLFYLCLFSLNQSFFFSIFLVYFLLSVHTMPSGCISSFLLVCLCSCSLLLFLFFFLHSPFLFFNFSVPFFLKAYTSFSVILKIM